MSGTSRPNRFSQSASRHHRIDRREFLEHSAVATGAMALSSAACSAVVSAQETAQIAGVLPPRKSFDFQTSDSLFHGHHWQTLNPGYWKIENGALRRRLKNYGDRARRTGFPFHAETHGFEFRTEYDPSLAAGVIYLPQWDLQSAFTVRAEFTYRGDRPDPPKGDNPDWDMYQPGFGLLGIAIGAKSVFESFGKINNAVQVVWADDGKLKILNPSKNPSGRQGGNAKTIDKPIKSVPAFELVPGQQCTMQVRVEPVRSQSGPSDRSRVHATLTSGEQQVEGVVELPTERVNGYVGIVARGLIDFEVNRFVVDPDDSINSPRNIGVCDCLACYPLGDTLHQDGDAWKVRFVGLFASDGQRVDIRVSDTEAPPEGWGSVPVCGSASIVNHSWRRNTASIDVTLPANPAHQTLYYTVWKDGRNVTADGRVGTQACGPGTGLVGDVPASGQYVGRLPQLTAPYKLCGLSCHALTAGLQQRDGDGWKMVGGRDRWQFRDQPTTEAYKHLESYDFQIMVWEDDVWYMELVLYPPSTDDAYKIVALSICGPTSRWQMMRHWNVINPGDHDYGMDDVKGPEQILVRTRDGLGQDPAYMRRNFQIVHHLITGDEDVDPYVNPKKWRAWKMPNRDFTLVILDSRLWRSSQDVDIWDDQGWQAFKSLYDRTDPTRSLLGESQFAWLQQRLATDSSPLICLTGINGLHTVWAGAKSGQTDSKNHPLHFSQRDRVTADYAGWVKAGADRVLELLGGRDGVVSVYGDVHNGCIMTNPNQRVVECSFGPIGRTGGRALIPSFGRVMKDVDQRDVHVHALYHRQFADPDQRPHGKQDPIYWNFLEMEFDPRPVDGRMVMQVRNLVDAPEDPPRGGARLETTVSQTGRIPASRLPTIRTLANADVHLCDTQGRPIRGTRSDAAGNVHVTGLIDVSPGTTVLVNAFDGERSESQVVTTT